MSFFCVNQPWLVSTEKEPDPCKIYSKEIASVEATVVGFDEGLGGVDPSFRALYGRLEFTVRRHMFNKDSFCAGQ